VRREVAKAWGYGGGGRGVLGLNESAHQARCDFLVPGGACDHASPQNLHVHNPHPLLSLREGHVGARASSLEDLDRCCEKGFKEREAHGLYRWRPFVRLRTHSSIA